MEKKRLLSIDTFRGMDMLLIMGLSTLLVSLCRLFPGGSDFWLARQMSHVEWNGLAIMDMVFPVFLFIAGLSFPFSYASQVEKGRTSWQIHRKIFVRCLVLIALLWGWVMKTFFPANPAPYLDCCVTVLILTAQLLSALKKWDCWMAWLIVNITQIILHISVGNVFMPIVCGLYLVNGLWSLYSWMKLYKKNG